MVNDPWSLLVVFLFLVLGTPIFNDLELLGPSRIKNPRADLQAVIGSTAAHALGLIVKQLISIGVPYLHDVLGMMECLGFVFVMIHGNDEC